VQRLISRVGLTWPAIADLLFVAALTFAFIHAQRTTADLEFGFSPDMYRDAGVAETMLNGDYPADSLYRDEWTWYNPVVPGLVAGLSWLSNAPPSQVIVAAGPFLNLLAPLGFYVLAARTLGRWPGLAAAISYLFLVENRTLGYLSSYHPWLIPSHFAECLFYFGLTAYAEALRTERLRWYLIFGVLLGLAFMTHTSPALLLGAIFALTSLPRLYYAWDEALQSERLYRLLAALLAALIPAALISWPLLSIIVGHYGLKTLNTAPATFRAPQMDLSNLGAMLGSQASIWTLGALLGGFHLLRLRTARITRPLLLLWPAVALAVLGYDYAVQLLARVGVSLPVLIPSWHMVLYLEAAKALCFGLGLTVALRLVAGMAEALPVSGGPRAARIGDALRHPAALTLTLAALVAVGYPAYCARYTFTDARDEALRVTEVMGDRVNALAWVRANTAPDDVFMTTDNHLAMFVVAQSGRKLVAAPPTFSNPYVDLDARSQDQVAMIDALVNGQAQRFERLAADYDLRFVAASGDARVALDAAASPQLQTVFADGDIAIYGLR
jgi:hypothetical protein